MIWTDDSSRIGSSQDQPPVSLFAVKPPVKTQPTKLNFKAELMTLSMALAIFNFAFAIVLSSMGFIR